MNMQTSYRSRISLNGQRAPPAVVGAMRLHFSKLEAKEVKKGRNDRRSTSSTESAGTKGRFKRCSLPKASSHLPFSERNGSFTELSPKRGLDLIKVHFLGEKNHLPLRELKELIKQTSLSGLSDDCWFPKSLTTPFKAAAAE
ncbi:hypothetical protein CEXT_220101 [Caerostris extrusa]|uniref:Uncharacterized protein n=1 Tax=Caerostris extrusa TaxID=172846 RepID=A0AAV4NI83_CAEEX|nr:hypothetical protein CEXT_220101 [Caerostris extrusa]